MITAFFRWLWRFTKKIALLVWDLIKTMKTWRGILALFISFMVFCGWAYVFIFLGTILKIHWMSYSGGLVAAFWAGPFTPLIPIVLVVALLIQRYVFFDRTNEKVLRENIYKLKTNYKTSNDRKDIAKSKVGRQNISYKNYIYKIIDRTELEELPINIPPKKKKR